MIEAVKLAFIGAILGVLFVSTMAIHRDLLRIEWELKNDR